MQRVRSTVVEFADKNATAFGAQKPARMCYQVARLPRDARVEIDAVAVTNASAKL